MRVGVLSNTLLNAISSAPITERVIWRALYDLKTFGAAFLVSSAIKKMQPS